LAFLDFKKNFISFCNVEEVCPLQFPLKPTVAIQNIAPDCKGDNGLVVLAQGLEPHGKIA